MTSPLTYGLAGGLQGFLQGKAQGLQFQVEDEIYRRRQAAQELKEMRLAEFRAGLQLGVEGQRRQDAFEFGKATFDETTEMDAQRAKRVNQAAAEGRAAGTPTSYQQGPTATDEAGGLLTSHFNPLEGTTTFAPAGEGIKPRTGKKPKTDEDAVAEEIKKKAAKEYDALLKTVKAEDPDGFVATAPRVAPKTWALFKRFHNPQDNDETYVEAFNGKAPRIDREGNPLAGELENPSGPLWRRLFQQETQVTVGRDYANQPGALAYYATEVLSDISGGLSVDDAVAQVSAQYDLDPQMQKQLFAEIHRKNPNVFSGTIDLMQQTGRGLVDLLGR